VRADLVTAQRKQSSIDGGDVRTVLVVHRVGQGRDCSINLAKQILRPVNRKRRRAEEIAIGNAGRVARDDAALESRTRARCRSEAEAAALASRSRIGGDCGVTDGDWTAGAIDENGPTAVGAAGR